MSGVKGMPRYDEEIKKTIVEAHCKGAGVRELSRQYGISRYAIQSWWGLRKEVELRHAAPLPKGRPKTQPEGLEQTVKRLKMENELLRNFLSAVGRR